MRPRHLPWQQGTRFRFDCAVYLYHTQECGPLGNEERQDRDSLGMHTVLHRRQESFETPENNAGWRLLGAKRRRAVRRQHSALRTSPGLVSACNDRPLYTGGADQDRRELSSSADTPGGWAFPELSQPRVRKQRDAHAGEGGRKDDSPI